MYRQTTARILRIPRRAILLIAALLVPLYAVSLTEHLEVPAQWREIAVGQNHAQVRELLRASGLADTQCEWRGFENSVRCTLIGQHHAGGIAVRFGSANAAARVESVRIHEPVYTGPFHLHARVKRKLRQIQTAGVR